MSTVGEGGPGWISLLEASVTVELIGQVGKTRKSYLTTWTLLKLFIFT